MSIDIQVTFDAANPVELASFWATALGYIFQPPPPGHDSWESALAEAGVPPEEWGDHTALIDPDGNGPRIFFQKVPEPKVAKNRVHLDVNAGGRGPEDERRRKVEEHVARLLEAGGSFVERFDDPKGYWVVMTDPEGNELCVQ